METLKQGQFSPLTVEEQVLVIFAGTSGLIDDVAVADIQRFQNGPGGICTHALRIALDADRAEKQITDEARADLKRAIGEFKEQFQAGQRRPAPSPASEIFRCPHFSISGGAFAR